MKLRDWIDSSKLNYKFLSGNKNAIELLKENSDKINWTILSRNTGAIELLRKIIFKDYLGSSLNSFIVIII